MTPQKESDLRGLWAVAWRSFVLLPLGLLLTLWPLTLFAILVVSLTQPPTVGVVFLVEKFWWQGGLCFVIWAAVIWFWRRFPIRESLDNRPPSI